MTRLPVPLDATATKRPPPNVIARHARETAGRSAHNAKSYSTVLDSLVVTYPFHPLVGQCLPILFERRLGNGLLYICEGGSLGTIPLPERWTNRAPKPAESTLTLEGLAKLAETIADLKRNTFLKEGEK